MKTACNRFVTGPAWPPPTVIRSTLRTGVTSEAVPVRNSSSAVYRLSRGTGSFPHFQTQIAREDDHGVSRDALQRRAIQNRAPRIPEGPWVAGSDPRDRSRRRVGGRHRSAPPASARVRTDRWRRSGTAAADGPPAGRWQGPRGSCSSGFPRRPTIRTGPPGSGYGSEPRPTGSAIRPSRSSALPGTCRHQRILLRSLLIVFRTTCGGRAPAAHAARRPA